MYVNLIILIYNIINNIYVYILYIYIYYYIFILLLLY